MAIIYTTIYLVLATAFTQFYKVATKTLKKAGVLTVILNVIVGYLFLNERDNLLRKIISAILIIISIILIKI